MIDIKTVIFNFCFFNVRRFNKNSYFVKRLFLRYAIHFIFNLWVILVVIYNFVEKTLCKHDLLLV